MSWASFKPRVLAAARVVRDVGVVYLAAVLLLALIADLKPRLGPAGLGAIATVLLYAGRALANGLHQRSRLALVVVGIGFLAAGVLYALAAGRVDEANAPMITVGLLVILYAWGVVFYGRRALTSRDLRRIATVLRERLEERGDSTEASQETREILARVRDQQRMWSSW